MGSEMCIRDSYERGAFTSTDTARVSGVFVIISLAIIPWSINQILTRSYYVQQKFWFPVVTGSFITLVTSIILFNAASDSQTYAWIIIFSLYIYCTVLLVSIKFNSEKIFNKNLVVEFSKIILILVLVYFVFGIAVSLSGLLNLIFSILLIPVVIFVSLSLLNFEYINIAKRR